MPPVQITTLGESLYWSYANLAMAQAAVNAGAQKFEKPHFMIRARPYSGLRTGTMNVGTIVLDERLKMILPQACSYCGRRTGLSVDHLIAKSRGGPESGDNIVWSCKPCNSSKCATDFLAWMKRQNRFPPLLLLRRYLKLVIEWSEQNGLLDSPLANVHSDELPFSPDEIPHKFPAPPQLRLWIVPLDET